MTDDIHAEKAPSTARAAAVSLEEHLAFERLLADLSARLANASGGQVETEIENALKQLLEFLDFDRSNFGNFADDDRVTVICSVAREGIDPYPLGSRATFAGWYLRQLRAGNIVRLRSIEDLPAEALGEIEYFRRSGIRASLGIPLRVGGYIISFVNFAAFQSSRDWPDDLIARLKIVGEVMAQALARKRDEAALQASEERWRSVFEASNLGISIIDQDLHYVAANSAFQAMLGYTEKELQQLTPVDITVDEDRESTRARIAELQRGQRRHFDAAKQYRRKDGTIIWGHINASVVQDAQTPAKLIIGTLIDITDTKRAQDALRATQSKLANMTPRMMMHELTAIIAHEVNQPLAAIVANGNAALRWLGRNPPEVVEASANITQIVHNGHRASQVISSVRGMFKKDEHARVLLDVNIVVREVLALLEGEFSSKRVAVHAELSRDLPQIFGSHVQLQQVILNLVTNAVDALRGKPAGSRMVNVSSKPSQPDGVIIAVEDSGTGIDPAVFDRIFDTFFTTKSHGMGMGLSICRSIVEAHGGRLWASVRHPQGSIFYVALPSATDDPRSRPGV